MRATLIVGCDLSSKKLALVARHPVTPTFAVAAFRLSKASQAYRPTTAAEAMYAMHEYLDKITTMAKASMRRVAYIESPVIGRGGAKSSIVQAYVNGVVQACFVQAGFDVEFVNVASWKAAVVGNGRADKTEVARYVRGVWPGIVKAAGADQDIYDAACIAIYGVKREEART